MTKHEIHPQAIVSASAKLGAGVQIGPHAVVGENVELATAACCTRILPWGPFEVRQEQCVLFVQCNWRRPAGLYLSRRAHRAGRGRRQYFPRIRHRKPWNGKGRSRPPCGDNNFFLAYSHVGHDCVIGSNHVVCEWCNSRGSCHRGRFRDDWRVLSGGINLPHRPLRLRWRIDGDYPGRATVFQNRHRARDEKLWHQCHRPGA